MGLIAALTHSSAKRADAFYFGMVVPQNPPFPTTGGKDIRLLGMSVLFLERQNTALTLFFSACVPFSWLSGTCHMKTKARTRWKTHKPTYANPSFSRWLLALSCTLSKLWYLTLKNSILTGKALTHGLFLLWWLSGPAPVFPEFQNGTHPLNKSLTFNILLIHTDLALTLSSWKKTGINVQIRLLWSKSQLSGWQKKKKNQIVICMQSSVVVLTQLNWFW